MIAVELSQRLQLARDLQRSLSPTVVPQLEGCDLAAYSQPAELVGGDCYDVALNGRLSLLIADATGHGLSAAVYMARAQAYLRAAIAAGKVPEEAFVQVNRQLVAHPTSRMFVTALCVQLDPGSRRLQYARAGHNPPLLIRKQQVHFLDLGAGPLGIFSDFQLRGDSVEMEEEDILVLYTDGVIEALNDRGEPFGEERLSAAILSHQRESAQEILDRLADAVNDFISPRSQEDDITAMVLKVEATASRKTAALPQPLVGGTQRPVALGFVRLGQVDKAGQSAVEAAVDQITARREAVWEKLSEDAFLTVFGAPAIHEDDAARALEALCELRSRVRDFPGMDLRAGLHVGQAILKPDGAVEYSLIGEALNLAFELERQAGPGQFLLSEELRHLAGGYLDLSKGLVALEGVMPPAHELLDIPLERIERWQRAGWTETTPYVGREAELQRLIALWQECSQQKSGQLRLIGIRGEAGLGKSRLLREFERQIMARHPQCLFLKGRARPYGAQPYALFSSLLQDYLGRQGQDRRAVLESKLDYLALHLPSERRVALQESCPILGHLLGIKYDDPRLQYLDPQGLQQEIQLALRDFLGTVISQSVPAPVILLEDLHWADAASMRLLRFLREHLEVPVPPLILATYREHYLIEGEEIVLDRLDRSACEALARAISQGKDLPDSVLHLGVERSDGNPLFLEELVQSLLHRGAAGDPVREVPETLMGLLLAQMDRLDTTARRVAQVAAVLGQEFENLVLRVMAKKARLEPEFLQTGLEALTRAGLVFLQGQVLGRFKHALTQEAAYETLLPGDRQTLHGFAAEAIEEVSPESIDAQVYALAHHYARARQRDKALHYICLALRQAFISADAERGLALAEEGLGLVGQVADREQALIKREILCSRRGIYLFVKEEYSQATADNEAIIALGQRFEDDWIAEAYAFGSWIYRKTGEYRQADQLALQALEFQERVSDPSVLGKVFYYAGDMMLWRGEYDQAVAYYKRAIDLRGESGEEWERGESYLGCGNAYLRKYELRQAESHYQQALEIFQAIRDRLQIASMYSSLGNCRFLAGDLEEAIHYQLQALLENTPFGKNWVYLINTTNLAQCYYESGQWEQAEHCHQECLQRARELGIRDLVLGQLYCLCRLYAERDQPEAWARAVQMAGEVLVIAEEIGYPGGRILGLSGKAMALLRLGRIEEACLASEEAVALLESQGKVGGNHEEGLLEERIFFEHYRVLSAAGHRAEADRYLQCAYEGLMALVEALGPEYREAVLHNLKFHRELVAAWEGRRGV